MTRADKLHHDFPVEVEAVALKGDPVQARPSEDFEHRERVSHLGAERNVEDRSKCPVCQIKKNRDVVVCRELPHVPLTF